MQQLGPRTDVVVEGPAARVTEDDLLVRLATAWSEKWDGRWQYQAHGGLFHHPGGGDALVYAVRPEQGPLLRQRDVHPHHS